MFVTFLNTIIVKIVNGVCVTDLMKESSLSLTMPEPQETELTLFSAMKLKAYRPMRFAVVPI